jgi:hypothetical protein
LPTIGVFMAMEAVNALHFTYVRHSAHHWPNRFLAVECGVFDRGETQPSCSDFRQLFLGHECLLHELLNPPNAWFTSEQLEKAGKHAPTSH